MKNKPEKNLFLPYLRTFLWMIVLLFGYALIISYFQELSIAEVLRNIWFLPIFMIVILFTYDQILKRFFFKKSRPNPANNFISHISTKAKEELFLNKEEFKELNKNETFQKSLSKMYQLFLSNERDSKKYKIHLKPFLEDSTEKAILELVIREATFLLHQKESE
jgi:hypothetical protein